MYHIIQNPTLPIGSNISSLERELIRGYCLQHLGCGCNSDLHCSNCTFPVQELNIRLNNIIFKVIFIFDFGPVNVFDVLRVNNNNNTIPKVTIFIMPLGRTV